MERGNIGSLVKPARSAGRRPAGTFLGRGDTLKNNETTRTCTPPGCFAEGGALGHVHAVAPQAHATCAHTGCRAMHDPRNTRHIGRFCMARLLLRPLHYQTTAARVGYLAWYGVLLLALFRSGFRCPELLQCTLNVHCSNLFVFCKNCPNFD
jgi:hypothetical protein